MTYHGWDEIRAFIETITKPALIVLYVVLFIGKKFEREIKSILAAIAGFIRKAETIQILIDKLQITLQSVKRLAAQSHDPELVRQTLLHLPDISDFAGLPEEGVPTAEAGTMPEAEVDEGEGSSVSDVEEEQKELNKVLEILAGSEG